MFGGMGQAKSQDRFGGGGEKCVDRVGNTVQVCLKCEEVVSVEVVELGEVSVVAKTRARSAGSVMRIKAQVLPVRTHPAIDEVTDGTRTGVSPPRPS